MVAAAPTCLLFQGTNGAMQTRVVNTVDSPVGT
jgi:hypothetical protein